MRFSLVTPASVGSYRLLGRLGAGGAAGAVVGGLPTQRHPTPVTGPGYESPPPVAARPARGRSRRWTAAVVAAAAVAIALAVTLPGLFSTGTPRADANHRPSAQASVASTPATSNPSPAVSSVAGSAPASGTPRRIAYDMLSSYGWSASKHFGCLDNLWNQLSGWQDNDQDPSVSYGIPQALPGNKMASAGTDWRTNPATQIKWGLGYIKQLYGSPCAAWSFYKSNGYY